MSDHPAAIPSPPDKDGAHYRFPIRRPVTILMAFITLLVFGWRSYEELPLNLMPDLSYPTLTVRTEYEGAAPEDIEKLVTRPVEERLSVVSGLVELSSTSSAGVSEIVLEFVWGTDMDTAMQDVRESLDMFDPPDGLTQKPIILRYDPTLDPVLRIALLGRDVSDLGSHEEREAQIQADLTEIREASERFLKSDLEEQEGIAQVRVKGGNEEEIQILLDSERIKSLGIGPEAVVLALQRQNVNLSGGRLKDGRAEYLVRTLNEFENIEAIGGAIIGSMEGQQFRLEDVARVELGTKERDTIVRVNGQEVVELEFFKEGDANVVQVSETIQRFFGFIQRRTIPEPVMKFMEKHMPEERFKAIQARIEREKIVSDRLRTRVPAYVKPVLISDQARFIKASIREVQSTAITGGLLALIILFLFLQELRTTTIIGVAIPISVVATFVPMFMGGISLNIMSLGGLALGVGMLVDNSIVVLESIFRCRQEGDSIKDAADRGTREVSSAVIASTLTTVAVFFPIVFVEGIAGQIFRDLALTVTFSLMASLSVALLLNPMIASREGWRLGAAGGLSAVSAFKSARTSGKSHLGALASVPGEVFRRAIDAARGVWRDTAGAMISHIRTHGAFMRVALAPFVLLAIVVFVLQVAIRIVAALLVGIMFLFTVIWGGSAILGYRALMFVFRLPLRAFAIFVEGVRTAYGASLRLALRVSPLVLLAVIALAVHAGSLVPSLGSELIPPMKQGEFNIRMEAPPGTRLEDTEQRAQQIEATLRQFAEVDTVTVQVGTDDADIGNNEGENVANISVKLKDPEKNVHRQDELIEQMRDAVLAITPDTVAFTLPSLFSFKTALELQIFGDDLDLLSELGTSALAVVEGVPGVKDADLSLKRGYPEVHIELDRELLATKNLEPFQVAQLLRTEVQGDIATRFNRAGDKVDIRVRTDQERLTSLDDLRNLSVIDGSPPIPLASVADVVVEEGPSEIRRIDQRQVAIVTANVEGRDLGSAAADVEARLAALHWPSGYDYTIAGQNRELEASFGGLLFALALAVFLVYVVMASQFESIWHPFLIMFTVPLAFVGVVYALWFANINVSVVVFIGGIVLAGIVVNAAIILVDYINQLRARGIPKTEAIVQAGTVRFRPIMMTTLTTLLGLIPMALSTGEGAEIRAPLAITVMAGLASATFLTLYVIPVAYHLFGGRDKP